MGYKKNILSPILIMRKKQTNINRGVVSLTVTIVTITSLISGSVTYIILKQALTCHINEKIKYKAEKINTLISDPLIKRDYVNLTYMIKEEIKSSDLRFAWVTDKNGIIVASNDEEQITSVIKNEYKNCPGFIHHKTNTGESICLLPDYEITEAATGNIIPWVLISALFSSVIIYRISLNFMKKITVPLLNAAQASASMAKGNFNINLPESEIEEIDTLNRTLTHTATTLLELTDHLQKEKNELNYSREEIRNLSEFRERIIDNASIWLEVLDKDARIIVWNKAAEEISGYSRDDAIGNPAIWELLYPNEQYRKSIMQRNSSIIKEGDVIEDLITVIRAKDGSENIFMVLKKSYN